LLNCLEKAGSKFSATGATKNLISGGYSSKCKDAVRVFIRQVNQELAVWTVLAWTCMGVKRGRGICVEIFCPQTETYNISQLIEFRDQDISEDGLVCVCKTMWNL
jgi:hypothetical protein